MKARGFTLIEISIVLAIIVVMSTIAYANFQGTSSRGNIINHAGKVLSALQTVQASGVSGRTNNSEVVSAWGLNLNRLNNKYTIFADYNNNGVYDYATKLLIHGSETVQSGGPSGSYLSESSNAAASVSIWNEASRESSGGKPSGTNGYWSFINNGYLSVPRSDDFYLADRQFSFDLWFKADNLGSSMNLFYLGDSESGPEHTAYRLYKDVDDKIVFEFSDAAAVLYAVSSADAISADTWYNVAVARDDSALLLFLGDENDTQLAVASSTPIMSTTTGSYFEQDLQIASDGSCPDLSCTWHGAIDEFRLLVGSPRFTKKFFIPTSIGKADDEAFKTMKLAPGIVFQRLYNNGAMVDELNIAWKINDSSHFSYVDNLPSVTSSLVINHAGAEDTNTDRDVPATITISSGGAFEKAGF